MLTDLDIRKIFRMLGTVYKAPDDRDDAARAWKYVLGDYAAHQVEAAAKEYMSTDARFFPKPGQIAARLRERKALVGGHGAAVTYRWKEGDGPCPVCGADLRLLEPSEQVFIDHVWEGKERRLVNKHAEAHADAPSRFGVLHDLDKHDGVETPFGVTYGFRAPPRKP